MALPATDQFTGVDETALTDYSANWTLCSGNFQIRLNAIRGNSNNVECGAGWNADVFANDQYSQGTIVSLSNYYYIGVAVRCDVATPSDNYYAFYGDENTSWLAKVVNGVYTQLGADGPGFVVSDIIRIEAEGTTIRAIINSVTMVEETDSDLSSGAAGLSGYHYGADTLLDDWEGGNLGGPTPAARSFMVVVG